MDTALLIPYVLICLNLALGFLVLIDNPRDALNHSFFIFSCGTALWIFCTDMVFIGRHLAFAEPALCAQEIVVLGFVLLANFFPYGGENTWKIKRKPLLFMLPWLVVFVTTFLDFISLPIFLAVMVWYVAWSLFTFFKKYGKLSMLVRTPYLPFAVGAGLFMGAALLSDILLPFFGISGLIFIGPLFSLFFVGCAVYAIIRYRFMEFQPVMQRTVAYAVAIFITASIYFGINFILQKFLYENDALSYPISGVIAAVVGALLFPYVKREFEAVTDRFFFRGEYDYFAAARELGKIFCSTIDLNDLLGAIGDVFSRTIKPEQIIFSLDGTRQAQFFDARVRKPLSAGAENNYKELIDSFRALPPERLFIKKLEHTIKDIQPRMMKKYQQLLFLAKKARIAAIVPIFSKEKASAVLLLGAKRSGAWFTKKDEELFSVVSHQAGMAIENAMLYAALHRHAEELERRVHERTERIKNMYEGQSKFLADLSHEFQTPISILKGNVERLEKTNNTKKKSEFYTMETTLDRLSRLVGNLLSIARLNSPKANLEKKRINVEKLLEQAYDDCLVLANDKGITLSFSSEKCFLFGNIDKLKEVLLNLISNALKHTLPGGAISLSARVIDDEVEIAVADTGSGISRKNLPHVFERLYKIDDNGLGGTGLGLHICRQIIEAHGGTITAESTVGKGSRFIVHLPLPLHDSGKFAIL